MFNIKLINAFKNYTIVLHNTLNLFPILPD